MKELGPDEKVFPRPAWMKSYLIQKKSANILFNPYVLITSNCKRWGEQCVCIPLLLRVFVHEVQE